MSLTPGSRIGPYEVVAPIGAGGMGEVFRARDTKLDRDVAIKALPAELAQDEERLARFEREAKLLASLNHPNIAHVYGFESATLEDGQSVHFLAMELVGGEDLAERLRRGAIPLDEALPIAKQIAEALEDAHEHGIIHRDLKPGNVKVTPDGKVKVLDFGLAKAMEGAAGSGSGAGSDSQLSHSPTMSRHATEAGIILGTAAYMSPEQARGKSVDKRADIWSFGVVLFEMLTGRRLFEGETVSDVLAGVLKTEVDLGALPAETPSAVRALLRRCLERTPKDRLHDIADARLLIEDALSRGGEAPRGVDATPVTPSSMARRLALALILLGIGAGLGWLATRSSSGGGSSAPRLTLRRLTDLPGMETSPGLSPDGKTLVYSSRASGNADIYVMRIDGGRAINITPGTPSDDQQPAFSPDGQQIAFRSSRDGGGLFIMGATGESVRRLTDEGYDPAWSPDGKRIAFAMEPVIDPYGYNGQGLWVVDVLTGEKRKLVATSAAQPAWSPDGRRIAYWASDTGQRDLWTIPIASGPPVAVTRDLPTDWSPEWSPDGRWLYFSSDRAGGLNLFRVAIDAANGGAAGEPEPVTTSAGNLGWARFSADGDRMAAAVYEISSVLDIYRLTTTPEPRLQPLRTLRPRTLHWCTISPDAEWLGCSTIGTPEDVVLLRADGSELRRLTNDVFKDRIPRWSHDGSRLAFNSGRSGGYTLWSQRSDGSELRQIWDSFAWGYAWRPDGRRITVTFDGHNVVDLDPDRMSKRSEPRRLPLPASAQGFSPLAWSPSGKLLGGDVVDARLQAVSAGAVDLERGVYLQVGLPQGSFVGWLPDSRHFVAQSEDQLALVDVETGEFRRFPQAGLSRLDSASLSHDGATLLVEHPVFDGDIWLLEKNEKKEPGK
jgi:serine/threonine protein kinase/Tol biopolymer transport system component